MRGHVARGHATTRVHVGARVGRHVAGLHREAPGVKWSPGNIGGAVTQWI